MTSAAPTLAFVHGGFCDATDWRYVMATLNTSFAVVAENLPGHGGAPLPPVATISALSDAVRQSIEAMADVILVGHSMGCAVALEAARQAFNVAGLVLIEGGMGAHADPARSREAIKAQIEAQGIGAFLSRLADAWFDDPFLVARARQRLEAINGDFARNLLLEAMRWDGEEAQSALGALRVPLLAVQTTVAGPDGRRSLQFGQTTPWLDLIRAGAPNPRILALAGMGHFPHVEESAVIGDIIAAFAQELAPS